MANIEMNYYNGSGYTVLYPQGNLSNMTGYLDYSKLINVPSIPSGSSDLLIETLYYTGTGSGNGTCTVNKVTNPKVILVTTYTGSSFKAAPGSIGVFAQNRYSEGAQSAYYYNYFYSMPMQELSFCKSFCEYIYSTLTGKAIGTISFSCNTILYPNGATNTATAIMGAFNVSGQSYVVQVIGDQTGGSLN